MSASVDQATEALAATQITPAAEGANNVTGGEPINAAENEEVIKAAAEGRRLYIGNLAYATTEGELKEFFTSYSVFVHLTPRQFQSINKTNGELQRDHLHPY